MKNDNSSNPSASFDGLSRESLRREWKILKFAWQMAERYHWWLLLVMLLEIVIALFPALAIYVVQDAVTTASHNLISLVTKDNFVLIILLLFVYLLLQEGTGVITSFAIIDVEYNIRKKYLSKILSFPLSTISKHMDNSAAFSMTQETSMTSGLIPMIYRSFLRAPITIVSAFVLLVIISPRMLALVTAMLLVVVGVNLWMRSRLKRFRREQYDATSSLLQYFSEWLTGHRIFRVYGAESFYEQKVITAFDHIAQVSKKHKLYATAQSVLVEILTYTALILFVVFLSDGDGYVNIGIVLSFPALILLIRGEMLKLVAGYQQLATTESSVSRLQWVLNSETPADTRCACAGQVDAIEMKDVSFGYDEDILHHAQLRLEKGKLNILTGPNGAGKSTTINLLLGLLSPRSGAISYDTGAEAHTDATFALVEQEPFVFQGTLYENIALGRAIQPSVIRDCIHAFDLDYLTATDEGMDLRIGAKGRALSSGEKQRLALVRALVGQPSVIILDEPTANIDVHSSATIRKALAQLAKDRLVLCVSHDPELVDDKAFRRIVLKDGQFQPYEN